MEITDGKGVPVVYDGVGKSTFEKSLECLKTRGMMVSFGNASGALNPIDVTKMLQPKGLFFVRPSMGQYLSTNEELNEASQMLFEKISSGKVKIDIFKKYKLDDVVQAHIDLESRKITGAAVIIPQSKSIFISDKWSFNVSVETNISLIKKITEIIIAKQQEPKIILAKKIIFK